MQNEEIKTSVFCHYCKKEFKAWKASLKFCSDQCKKQSEDKEDEVLRKYWSKVSKQLAAKTIIAPNNATITTRGCIVPIRVSPKTRKAIFRLRKRL